MDTINIIDAFQDILADAAELDKFKAENDALAKKIAKLDKKIARLEAAMKEADE
jgi:ubiquinone biosynthesis protein UbiJ